MAVNWDKLSRTKDRQLRPWAVDAEMDSVLDEAYQDLQQSTRRCSPYGKGGPYGLSTLDRTPLELKEIEELIRHPERFEDADGQLKRKKRITRKKPVPVQVTTTSNEDKSRQRSSSTKESLRKANRYVSAALDNKANLIRERNQKNPIKACYQLDSIKYTESGPRKGPAVFNMSMAEYQRFLGRIAAKGIDIDSFVQFHIQQRQQEDDQEQKLRQQQQLQQQQLEEFESEEEYFEEVKDTYEPEEREFRHDREYVPLPETDNQEIGQVLGGEGASYPSRGAQGGNDMHSGGSGDSSKHLTHLNENEKFPMVMGSGNGNGSRPVSAGQGQYTSLGRPGSAPVLRPASASALSSRGGSGSGGGGGNNAKGINSSSSLARPSSAGSKVLSSSSSSRGGLGISQPSQASTQGLAPGSGGWLKVEGTVALSQPLPLMQQGSGLDTDFEGSIAPPLASVNNVSFNKRPQSANASVRPASANANANANARHGTSHSNQITSSSSAIPGHVQGSGSTAAVAPRLTISREGNFVLGGGGGGGIADHHHEDTNNMSSLFTNTVESNKSTSEKGSGTTRILSHKRISELKSLRDLMMTATGSVSLNVHPETSQDCIDENQRMKEITQRCIQDCIEKNHADNAGPLLYTPGYMETIGPSKFYQSDTERGFQYDEKKQKACRNVDLSNGIKMDPLRMFIENAAKNKQKIFGGTPGGGFKFN